MNNLVVYLDNCCFNRPYDDQDYLSIYIETQAKLAIQELIKDKMISLAWSFMLDFENSANPDVVVKKEIFTWRKISTLLIDKSTRIVDNAKKIARFGLSNKDALHIASAIDAKVNYFITGDKGILKKKNLIRGLIVCSPIDFIDYLEEKNYEV